MPEEPATLTPEAPPQAPSPDFTPEPAPASSEEAAPEPSAVAPEPEPSAEPPAWHALTEVSEVLGHESFTDALAERDDATYTRVKTQMQPVLQRASQAMVNIETEMKAMRTKNARMVKDGVIDEETRAQMEEEAPQLFKDFNTELQNMGRNAGNINAVNTLLQGAGASMPDAENRLNAILTEGNPDPTFVEDVLSAITKTAVEKAKAKWEGDAKKVVEANVRDEAQAKARTDTNAEPPAEPTAGAGGGGTLSVRSMAEADAAYNEGKLTHTQYKQAREKFNVPEIAR